MSGDSKKLMAHTAEILTASVEIKALKVSGKQMTIALFKQLKSDPIVTHDGYLAGVPWGVINYHPDNCADSSVHRHVIWQDGEELKRAYEEPPVVRALHGGDDATDLLIADSRWRVTEGGVRIAKWADWARVTYDLGYSFELDDTRIEGYLIKDVDGQIDGLTPVVLEEIRNSREELFRRVTEKVRASKERATRRSEAWKQVRDLPQLFIAV